MWVATAFVLGGVVLGAWALWKAAQQAARDRINAETAQEVAEIWNRVQRANKDVEAMSDTELDDHIFAPTPGVRGPSGVDGGPERRE